MRTRIGRGSEQSTKMGRIRGWSGAPAAAYDGMVKRPETPDVDKLIGKKLMIAGMAIEILGEDGEHYQARNLTTDQTLAIEKSVIQKAVKLGKAEETSASEDRE